MITKARHQLALSLTAAATFSLFVLTGCATDSASEGVAETPVEDEAPVEEMVKSGSSWPGWRGVDRTGRSTDTDLLATWPENGPPLVWEAEGLGHGFSSVAVADGRLFTLGDVFDEGPDAEGGREFLIALDAQNGTELWRTEIGEAWAEKDLYPGSRSTPSVSGNAVVALASDGTLVHLDATSGEQRWAKNLTRDFQGAVALASAGVHWTYSESPLIDGDRVVVTPGIPELALLALNLDDGEEIWRTSVPELGEKGGDGAGYSSVVISEGAGVKQYVQLIGRGLIGVRASDGAFLWGYNRVANNVANIPTPLIQGDYVFASTGYGTGAALLQLRANTEGGVDASEVYFLESDVFQNHHGGMILHDGVVYAGTGHNRGFPIALELVTGKVLWGPERNDGRGSAAVAFADGKVYMRYQNGLMLLADATREGYSELGSFEIPGVKEPSWSHPAIVGGQLYLREQDRIHVYDVSHQQVALAQGRQQ